MKKLFMVLPLVFLLCFTFSCKEEEAVIERFMEDGVEVVVNHLKPYKVKGEPNTLLLEEEFSIDTERDEIAELGLTDIGAYFDADSKGNIFLIDPRGDEHIIFKFNKEGNFITSFCRRGQGPGELGTHFFLSLYLVVDHNDNIVVSDTNNNKISTFGSNGNLKNEIKFDANTYHALPLDNGNYIKSITELDGSAEYLDRSPLTLFNSKFEEIKILDRKMVPNPIIGKRLKAIYHIMSWRISNGKIFTASQERGYEIKVYDFEGELARKIKKEYKPIPVPADYKKSYMAQFEAPMFDDIRKRFYFPNSMPAFHSFFSDDEGRLFVMTYEKGENSSEYMYDIFNPDGLFIGRKSLDVFHNESDVYAKVKDGRFYCLREKESGYKELLVYNMNWE